MAHKTPFHDGKKPDRRYSPRNHLKVYKSCNVNIWTKEPIDHLLSSVIGVKSPITDQFTSFIVLKGDV